jgi:folate-binding protein YgfZ
LSALPQPAVRRRLWAVGSCAVIWIEGPDAASFLHGLVTAGVADMPVRAGRLALLLDAKGHIVAPLQIVRDAAEGFTLITAPELADSVHADLERFHFSEDLVILGPEVTTQITVDDDLIPPDVGVAAPGWVPGTAIVVCEDPSRAAPPPGLDTDGADELERRRIRAGRPVVGIDTGPSTLVQEAMLEDVAVDFTKGCYLGQETVARAQHRGRVNRRLRGLISTTPLEVGAMIRYDGRTVGAVSSAVEDPLLGALALGIVRREVPDGATVEVGAAHASATLSPLPIP